MSSEAVNYEKPHAVCVPYPSQGHVHPMLKVAKLLHAKGFHITFVNTEFNNQRLLRSNGPDSVKGLEDFRFETIPDGLPPSNNYGATQDVPSLCDSTAKNCRAPFRDLVARLNSTPGIPPVTCVVSDGVMTFSLDVAGEFQIPGVAFWTASACGMMGYLHYRSLMERGIIPFKDDSYLMDGTLDTQIDWIPGMGHIRLRDLPSFIRTTDAAEIMFNFMGNQAQRCRKATAVMFNTFDDLEKEVLDALTPMLPPIYTIGFLPLQSHQIKDVGLKSIGSSLWKEDMEWLEWLEGKEPASVFYVNFGSITTMTTQNLIEFAWGLADSNHPFLWVIRADLVKGETAVVPPEFVEATGGRGLLLNWVPQEELLQQPAIGGFLTHCGWNSTGESFCGGVPVVCWPFFAEQQTNCRYACTEWGVGMEVDKDVRRTEVEALVREVMKGEKGKEMRENATEWRRRAERATRPGGSSYENLNRLITDVLRPRRT
ncbi:hypothetical protein H6P81_011419 [Aristolochia fimbriata]|uniref:Glycosyltransferase n=1 Tax=Aristolochia fimbriata TaxID=158543 RepID=A0AAV7ES71_ARIFI|nr:hypothetical protein H6P81_011419 [Aristolochia fimbriata]